MSATAALSFLSSGSMSAYKLWGTPARERFRRLRSHSQAIARAAGGLTLIPPSPHFEGKAEHEQAKNECVGADPQHQRERARARIREQCEPQDQRRSSTKDHQPVARQPAPEEHAGRDF